MLTYFVVSSYLQLWFLFIFACKEPPPQSERKKVEELQGWLGYATPRKRGAVAGQKRRQENGGKQLQVAGKFLDTENFLGLCFSSLFPLLFSCHFSFSSVHFKMRHFLVCWPRPSLVSPTDIPSGSFMNFLQSSQVFSSWVSPSYFFLLFLQENFYLAVESLQCE